MKTIKQLGTRLFLLLAILCASCGADGEDGMDGADGEQGIPGQDGNANVISVLFENQTIETGDTVFEIPELSQEIYDTGIVYAYVTVTGNEYWEVLPLSIAGQIILEIDRIEIGRATLRANFTQSNLRLRFVLIPGNVIGDTVDFTDYDQVEDYFGL